MDWLHCTGMLQISRLSICSNVFSALLRMVRERLPICISSDFTSAFSMVSSIPFMVVVAHELDVHVKSVVRHRVAVKLRYWSSLFIACTIRFFF